jgi:hypothetical protein
MFDDPPKPSPFPHGPNDPKGPDDTQSQRIPGVPSNARVPEKVSRGVMATGALVIHGPQEFVIDFVQALTKPELVARVVVPPNVAFQILSALQENFSRYVGQFGQPMQMPKPAPGERPKSPQEIYDDLKISDDMYSGVYANGAMVGHTPSEFYIDFLTSFFPRAAVSSRVYISVPRMQGFIDTLSMSVGQYRKAMEQQQKKLPPEEGAK